MLRPFASVAVFLAGLAGCSSSSAGGGSKVPPDGGSCTPPVSVTDAGAGVISCNAARAWLSCKDSSGAGCDCLTDDPTKCVDCQLTGVTCTSTCGAGEYAVGCGGPPGPAADGGAVVYEPVPASCTHQAPTPAGLVFACCPCP